ncbi:UNVERIFIED_CONTAM: hypothetical protein B566_EDAN017953 [Ephemera danica]|nr:hypothetical protein B566_EDAN017953 [Ephemera danica]
MVIGAFPVFKLGTLFMKQISKPLANFVKQRAKNNYFFRTYICMPPAQFYNWCEVKAKMWSMNLGSPIAVPKLNEAMAIDLGANLLGETIIFLSAAGILILEYTRSSRKEKEKEQAHRDEMNQLHAEIMDLYFMTEQQKAQITELHRMMGHHHTHFIKKIFSSEKPAEPQQNQQHSSRIQKAITDSQKRINPS